MTKSEMEFLEGPKQVAEGIYQIQLPTPFAVGPVNVYVIAAECLTLVDAGPKTEEAWEALQFGLEQIGYGVTDIQQVILTHHHVDHSGLLERVRRACGANIYAHPFAVPYVEYDEQFMAFHDEFFEQLYRECGVPQAGLEIISKYRKKMDRYSEKTRIDASLQHEQALPHLPEWQVIYTPGHSQSHLSLLRKEDRVMIAGDHVIKHISSNAFIEPPRDQSRSRPFTLVQYRTALEMVAAMDVQLILPGHGDPVTEHRELITHRLQRNWDRTDTLRRFLESGEKTAYELSTLLFPQIYEKELPLVLSETLGHIDLLTIVGQIEVRENNGVLYYSRG